MTAPGAAPRAGRPEAADRVAWVAAGVLAIVVALAVAGPWLAPHEVGRTVGRPYDSAGPGWLGTEVLGRDVWSRVLHGGRRLVMAPLLITAVTTVLGALAGVAAAASRPARVALHLLDVVAVLPAVMVLLVLLYRFGGSTWVVGLAVVVTSTPFVARYVRAVAAPVLQSGYVLQARLLGDPRRVILRRDVLANLAGPILADAALRLSGACYVIAAAGFLGFGPASPSTDWASMVDENLPGIRLNVWSVAAPAIAIAAVTVPLNLLADRVAARWNHP